MNKIKNISMGLTDEFLKANKNKNQCLNTEIGSFIADLPDSMELILKKLSEGAEKISDSAYKKGNYIIIPQEQYNHTQIMSEASKYMDKNPSLLSFEGIQQISDYINVYLYKIGNGTENLINYDKNIATDRAKQDFYYNLKNLIDGGKVDIFEILDETKWYMTTDGKNMYNISPHLSGYIAHQDREKVAQELYNKLFNHSSF